MKKALRNLVTITALGLLVAPFAQADEALFQKSGCAACHAVDQQRMGPTMKLISAKYAGQADAPAALAQKVRAGGSGVWGKIPMPPTPATKVSDADLNTVITWMLSH